MSLFATELEQLKIGKWSKGLKDLKYSLLL